MGGDQTEISGGGDFHQKLQESSPGPGTRDHDQCIPQVHGLTGSEPFHVQQGRRGSREKGVIPGKEP